MSASVFGLAALASERAGRTLVEWTDAYAAAILSGRLARSGPIGPVSPAEDARVWLRKHRATG